MTGMHRQYNSLSPCSLVVVDIDPLQLQVVVSSVGAAGVHSVLIADDLPELWTMVREDGGKEKGASLVQELS